MYIGVGGSEWGGGEVMGRWGGGEVWEGPGEVLGRSWGGLGKVLAHGVGKCWLMGLGSVGSWGWEVLAHGIGTR